MQRPDQFPTVPYATFIDAVGPSINSDFLNRLQEGFTDVIGALFGKSATLIADEFTTLAFPLTSAGLFELVANVNGGHAAGAPVGPGDHGILQAAAAAAGPAPFQYRFEDAPSDLGTFDFTFSGKAAVTSRAVLNSAGADGFVIGLRNPPAALGLEAVFVAGSDKANWQALLKSTMVDTGVPVVDGRMYRFQISRISGTAYAFIDGLLVATVAFPDPLPGLIRQIKIDAPTATMGDGYLVDYHRALYSR